MKETNDKYGLDKNLLLKLLQKQISNFFILERREISVLKDLLEVTLQRFAKCVEHIDNKYFSAWGGVNPYHSGQYLIYLYFFSNVCSNTGEKNLADKLYYLNKIMNSVDIYHEVALPESFFFEHPVGTVLGRAKYGNKFFAMQNCTVGGNKGKYPIIGENVKLYSGAKILGNCIIGDNVSVSANTYIKDTDIPDNTIVFGTYPNLILKSL